MPEAAEVIATPATPPQAAAAPPPPDPLAPQQVRTLMPEDDPNHHMAQLISRRRVKKEAEAKVDVTKGTDGTDGTNAAPVMPEPPKAAPGLNNLIASALKMPVGAAEKAKEAKEAKDKAAAEKAAKAAETAAAAPAEPAAPKTIVAKKKAGATAPAAPDITEITTAATTAAVRALQSSPSKPTDAVRKPEDDLKPDDLHDYEVAVKLSEINPKYKDAPRVVLDQVRRSEQYATRWETANPGKEFDPDADEHNEFFDGLEKPWSDHEFRTAEIEMAAERVAAKTTRANDTRIKALEQDNARLELTPVIERTFTTAAGHLAKQLDVYDKVANGSWDKFADEDPITAQAMADALGPLQPLIEAIVQIDDPKGRFPVDDKNPAHQSWLALLADKEGAYAGVENEGKMFATRIAYSRMNTAQRTKHWYLTPDLLVSEVVQDAVTVATERVKTEKERIKKMAASMGYTMPEHGRGTPQGESGVTSATNGEAAGTPPPRATTPTASSNEPVKPVSPSVGSGAKIDTKGGAAPTGKAATLAALHNVLFGGS